MILWRRPADAAAPIAESWSLHGRTKVVESGDFIVLAQRHGLGETGPFEKRIEPVWAQGPGLGEKPGQKIPA